MNPSDESILGMGVGLGIYFKTLCSNSRGNCELIWTETTRIAIDCGFKSQRACRQLLRNHAGGADRLDAVLVSHAHTDHIDYPGLRVLASEGVRIRAHERVVNDIHRRHGCDRWDESPVIEPFGHGLSSERGAALRAIQNDLHSVFLKFPTGTARMPLH